MSEPSPDVPAEAWSGVHRGPLREGEWVRLVDQKGRKQYLYHPKWRQRRDQAKFDELQSLLDPLVGLARV